MANDGKQDPDFVMSIMMVLTHNIYICRVLEVFTSRPQYLSGLDCTGAESSLLECVYDTPLGTACRSGRGMQVTCVVHSTTDDNGTGVNKAAGEECI